MPAPSTTALALASTMHDAAMRAYNRAMRQEARDIREYGRDSNEAKWSVYQCYQARIAYEAARDYLRAVRDGGSVDKVRAVFLLRTMGGGL